MTQKAYYKHPVYPLWITDTGAVLGPRGPRCTRLDRYGYERLNIVHNGKTVTRTVHRLLADVFFPGSQGTVNHIDGNKANNTLQNLELVSSADNTKKAFIAGLVSTCHPVEISGIAYYSKRAAERATGVSRRSL